MFSKAFWVATVQRVIRSFAASLSALLVADGTGVLDANWVSQLSAAGMAAVVTLLLCLAGEGATKGAGPAFGYVEITSPPAPKLDGEHAPDERGQISQAVLIAFAVIGIIAVVMIIAGRA